MMDRSCPVTERTMRICNKVDAETSALHSNDRPPLALSRALSIPKLDAQPVLLARYPLKHAAPYLVGKLPFGPLSASQPLLSIIRRTLAYHIRKPAYAPGSSIASPPVTSFLRRSLLRLRLLPSSMSWMLQTKCDGLVPLGFGRRRSKNGTIRRRCVPAVPADGSVGDRQPDGFCCR